MDEQAISQPPEPPARILCRAIDIALVKRQMDGLEPPDAIACGPKVAEAWPENTTHLASDAYTREIKIKPLPMMGNDAALLLSRNRILDIVSIAQPREKG